MAEKKQITALHVITDTETGMESIGEIDGGYIDKVWLKSHIKRHGTSGLLYTLAWMNSQIFNAKVENDIESMGHPCGANVKS